MHGEIEVAAAILSHERNLLGAFPPSRRWQLVSRCGVRHFIDLVVEKSLTMKTPIYGWNGVGSIGDVLTNYSGERRLYHVS